MSQDRISNLEIEDLWDALLSRQAERVRAAFGSLDIAHQHTVSAHLLRMASEDDWHPEQRLSAQAALAALEDLP